MEKTKLMKWAAYIIAALSIVLILQGNYLIAVFNSVVALLIFMLAQSFEQTDFWIERWRQAMQDFDKTDKELCDVKKAAYEHLDSSERLIAALKEENSKLKQQNDLLTRKLKDDEN
jgi:uncharacterized membrane protein